MKLLRLTAALFLLLIGGVATAAFPVQSTQTTGQAATVTTFSLSLTALASAITSGNSVAVSYAAHIGGGTFTTSVTDDKGNAYTTGSIFNDTANSGSYLVTAYALNVTNGPKTITITANGTVSGTIYLGGAAYEVPGPVTVDVNKTATQSSTTAINIAFTTANAGEYAIISAGDNGGLTITSQTNGWTQEQSYSNTGGYQVYSTLASSGSNSWQATSSIAVHIGASILTFAPSAASCTNNFWSANGTYAIPNGTTGSYWSTTGLFATPNCSTGSYWFKSGGEGGELIISQMRQLMNKSLAFVRLSHDQSTSEHLYCDGDLHIHVTEPDHKYSGVPLAIQTHPCDCNPEIADV